MVSSPLFNVSIANTPIPGRFYKIRKGDTLFGITSKAYGVGPGGRRLELAKFINGHSYNHRFQTSKISSQEKKLFGGPRISLSPKFPCTIPNQTLDSPVGKGKCFAAIWIPRLDVPAMPKIARINAPARITTPTTLGIGVQFQSPQSVRHGPIVFWQVVFPDRVGPASEGAKIEILPKGRGEHATLQCAGKGSRNERIFIQATTDPGDFFATSLKPLALSKKTVLVQTAVLRKCGKSKKRLTLIAFGAGYQFYKTPKAEISAIKSDTWVPSSVDLQVTAKQIPKALFKGVKSFKGLTDFIRGQNDGSIKTLFIIGHANQSMLGFGGKRIVDMTKSDPVDIEFSETMEASDVEQMPEKEKDDIRCKFAPKARVFLVGCHSIAPQDVAGEISKEWSRAGAVNVTAIGFSQEVQWCIQLLASGKLTRGRVATKVPRKSDGSLAPCHKWKTLKDLL